MSREEYLNQLKNNLLSLSSDEQTEALQYYADYFDEANDDEKVINELGSPEELAKTIIEKFANALVDTKKTDSDDSNKEEKQNNKSNSIDALYYEFDKNKVSSIKLNFGAADVVLISGNKLSIETRGITEDLMNCYLSSDGILTVNNTKRINLNFWSHDRRTRVVPRILITIPENLKVNTFKASIGAGNLRTKKISLAADKIALDVGAGNLQLDSICGGKVNARCGMGNLELKGTITGSSIIDCGMGNVKFELSGNKDDYSYDVKVGLGDFKFNDEKKSGVCHVYNNQKKENHFSVNCGMGSVFIKIQ